MTMICAKCRRTYNSDQDYCDVCSCPPEGIWQMLRPIEDVPAPLTDDIEEKGSA